MGDDDGKTTHCAMMATDSAVMRDTSLAWAAMFAASAERKMEMRIKIRHSFRIASKHQSLWVASTPFTNHSATLHSDIRILTLPPAASSALRKTSSGVDAGVDSKASMFLAASMDASCIHEPL
jgi:hypothetical protein